MAEESNKRAMQEIVMANKPAGLLALYEVQPIAWCAFAPREDFIKLEKSRVHKRIDEMPVWSIPCFFIDKNFRRNGVSVELLKGVINYAGENGIKVIEAYPTIPTTEKLPDSFAWIGLFKSFERAGFEIADRTSKKPADGQVFTLTKLFHQNYDTVKLSRIKTNHLLSCLLV